MKKSEGIKDLEKTACNINPFDERHRFPALYRRCGIFRSDTLVLFGGTILRGDDEAASAVQNGIALKFIIVGGEGRTTDALRKRINEKYLR